jgi:hypothetical protein
LSLTNSPLSCTEYVKLELQSGQGRWKSGVTKMKVNKGLCFPLILGMPFLSSEHIVIDTHKRTAVDKRTGYDLINPPPFKPRKISPPRVTPPPTPKKVRVLKPPSLEQTGPPALAGYLLPGPVMAAVRDRIEAISFQEVLKAKDAKMKLKFADRFPLRLPIALTTYPGTCSTESDSKTPPRSITARGMRLPRNTKSPGRGSSTNISRLAAYDRPPQNTPRQHSAYPNTSPGYPT